MNLLILVSMWIRGLINVMPELQPFSGAKEAKVASGMLWLRAVSESIDYLLQPLWSEV